MHRAKLLVPVALALSLAFASAAQAVAPCVPVVPAQMGACTPRPLSGPLFTTTLHGTIGVDVSVYQGHPDWAAARRAGLPFAIDKAGEGGVPEDPTFAANQAAQRALGIPHGSYWFLRPTDCTGQADQYARDIRAAGGLGPSALAPEGDAEVALPSNCVGDFNRRLEHDLHLQLVVDYTAPGTWPGGDPGDAELHVATYGPAPGCVSAWPCRAGRPRAVAWQFADSQVGPFPHSWSGIGPVDTDLDEGLLRLRFHYPRWYALQADLKRHQCSTHPQPARYAHACSVWSQEVKTA